ncbi:hypothetical protein CHARACLAT_011814 [Characodon lateralis]|uniref:Uncharacterized protein n=1 Tax=Characodon lateralis TaxID=208331 RepID=A0ABU7DHX8_9TELE|nr:hypothetical protein [Characodon lateralis]
MLTVAESYLVSKLVVTRVGAQHSTKVRKYQPVQVRELHWSDLSDTEDCSCLQADTRPAASRSVAPLLPLAFPVRRSLKRVAHRCLPARAAAASVLTVTAETDLRRVLPHTLVMFMAPALAGYKASSVRQRTDFLRVTVGGRGFLGLSGRSCRLIAILRGWCGLGSSGEAVADILPTVLRSLKTRWGHPRTRVKIVTLRFLGLRNVKKGSTFSPSQSKQKLLDLTLCPHPDTFLPWACLSRV